MNGWISMLLEAAKGSFSSVLNIALIVFPLMVAMELAKNYKLLDRVTGFLRPLTNFFGMSKESSFPLLVGLVFGLAYGAGVIVQSSEEGNLSKKDLILLVVFLANCHALVEDTFLFVAIGANGYILFTIRALVAVLTTWLLSKRIDRMRQQTTE